MSSSPQGFAIYRLAKKLAKIKSCEKAAAVIMADHIGKPDGVCNASLPTMAAEHGNSIRQIRYGINGRKRKDGSVAVPGVVARGLFVVSRLSENPHTKGGRGLATEYQAELSNWYAYLPSIEHARLDAIIGNTPDREPVPAGEKGEQNPAQKAAQTRHNSSENPAQRENRAPVSPLFSTSDFENPAHLPPNSLNQETPPPNSGNLVARLAGIFAETGHGILSRVGSERLAGKIQESGSDSAEVEASFRAWLLTRSTTGLKHPLTAFEKEFDEASAIARVNREDEIDLAEVNRIVDENLAKKKAIDEAEAEERRAQEEYERLHQDEIGI